MSQKLVSISLESKQLAEQAVAEELITERSNDTLKQCWIKLGEQLEIDGIPKNEILSTARKIILEIKSKKTGIPVNELSVSTWLWEIYRDHGWTNSAIPREDSDPNSSIYTLNEQIIQRLKRTKEICDEGITKFETIIDISRVYDEKQSKQFLQQWDQILQMAEDGFNEKTKIPNYTQLILLYYLSTESSVTNGAKVFMKARVELMEELGKFLTAKQAGKFQTGDIKDQLPILKPYSRDTAIFLKYWGIQCIKCNSWCVKDFAEGSKTKLKCIDCEEIFDPVTISKCRVCQIPLYKEDLLYIIENGKCKNCKEVVHLPQELVAYTRS